MKKFKASLVGYVTMGILERRLTKQLAYWQLSFLDASLFTTNGTQIHDFESYPLPKECCCDSELGTQKLGTRYPPNLHLHFLATNYCVDHC